MKFKIQFASEIVGVFVLAAVVALAAILIMMGINQRWFARNYYYTSRFASGKGLERGMSINFKGFEIGKITDIYLTDDDDVEIRFYIQDAYQPKVFENSVLQHTSSALGFGGDLIFHQGVKPTNPLEEFSYIPSLDLPEGRYLVSRGLVKIAKDDDAITRVVEDIEPILENVTALLVSLNTTIRALNEPGAEESALGDVMKNLVQTTGDLSKFLRDARPGINGIINNLDDMSRDPRGLVTKLLDPKGSLATLLDDNDRLFNQVESILRDASFSMGEVKNFSTTLTTARPQILELLEEGRQAVRLSQDVLEGLRNNPLLSGGISPRLEAPTTQQGYRDEVF
ncbi:MAG: MlaD family protein [Spirochaetales bacterium]|jgi:phospholipid/cholesterol/gamma-HCH transport system substrate-binding protein|nr:MlaD family protein [Spirochaetales bacterium]